ncbi:ABC transporter substrate-binding protein [Desertimonas flava]|uniref:ABC transporter substrate-binding protein n=1 Tax=Desertimonas flava TaxID=2064846 RepID=UPI000E3441B8|nr:ABC transporter substrate-binding protein [Desertimonas flava]
MLRIRGRTAAVTSSAPRRPARRRSLLVASVLVAATTISGVTTASSASPQSADGQFPRNESLITSGTQWGPPSSWNPLQGGGQAMGVRGLLYETLFLFNPWTLELEPWLAESGSWTAEDTYELKLRAGLTWQDGEPLTAADVAFTLELGHEEAVKFTNVWTYLESVEAVDDTTVVFTFSDPRAGEWDNFLTSNQIVPQHLWADIPLDELGTYANSDNPIGSGAYRYHSTTETRMVWERNDDWWGIEALGLEMKPRYIIDLVNPSNEVALGLISRGDVDMSNNFLPGIQQLVNGDFGITTFYPEEPYMLSANTAMLIPNTNTPPLDDAAFRRALAGSIDTELIASNVYGGIVRPANPTGLLPSWDRFVDADVVAANGFSFDPEAAAAELEAAGYVDTDGDGFVETPEGEAISLSLITPAGWTDWNQAAQVIADSAAQAGIRVESETPSSQEVDERRNSGDFDLVMNNWNDLQNTPWTYYDYLFRLPVQDTQSNANFARYTNDEAWELTQLLGRTAVTDPAIQEPLSRLQEIALTEMPAIPMWYNGLWSQVSNEHWTNWPTGDGAPFPTTWSNFWEKGAIYWLTQVEPVS